MANRFWVGGTGTWDTTDTTHWAATSNGAGGQSVPGSADPVTMDANSGGGTITVNGNHNVQGINCGGYTNGTLDFSVNTNTITIGAFGFNNSGSVTRTVKLGACTFFTTNLAFNVVTGLTFIAGTSTINMTGGASAGITTGGTNVITFNKIIFGSISTPNATSSVSGIFSINTLEFDLTNPGIIFSIQGGTNLTINNSFRWSGRPNRPIAVIANTSGAGNTITLSSGKAGLIEWANIYGVTFTGGGTFVAKNSFDGSFNSGITIYPPQSSGIGAR